MPPSREQRHDQLRVLPIGFRNAHAAVADQADGTVAAQNPDIISFAPGYPAPEAFAWDDYREIATSLLAGRQGGVLQYGPTRGHKPLLEFLVSLVGTRGIRTSTDDIIVTTGSQQGLDVIARLLLDPGDVALVELPSYAGAITAFRNVRADLVGVRQDRAGVDLDHLDSLTDRLAREGRRPKFLYVVPNFQNPTGQLMSLARRAALLEWAERRDMLLVEDDPYGALYFEGAATPAETRPIKADDASGRVLYLSSFSKTLAPRSGWRGLWPRRRWPRASKRPSRLSTSARAVSTNTWCTRRADAACSIGTCPSFARTTSTNAA